jgi:hypothetical protein
VFQASLNDALRVLQNPSDRPTRLPENTTPKPNVTENDMADQKDPSAKAGCTLLTILFTLSSLGVWKLVNLIGLLFQHYRHGG